MATAFIASKPGRPTERPSSSSTASVSRGEDWANLIPGFADNGFHVYVPDLLGYGRSPQPDVDYSISLQESLVVHFMQAASIPKAGRRRLVDGRLGSRQAHPRSPRNRRTGWFSTDSAGIYFPATFDATLFTPSDRAGLTHLTEMLQPFPQPLPGFIAQAAIEKLQRSAWIVTRSVAAMTSGHDLLDFRLAKISRPTLLVWGGKDVLIPPSVGESMHHLIPDSSMTIIDGCGHLAPAQCAAPALSTTLKFLKADPPLKNVEQTLPGS